jgi:hypothetical protein
MRGHHTADDDSVRLTRQTPHPGLISRQTAPDPQQEARLVVLRHLAAAAAAEPAATDARHFTLGQWAVTAPSRALAALARRAWDAAPPGPRESYAPARHCVRPV